MLPPLPTKCARRRGHRVGNPAEANRSEPAAVDDLSSSSRHLGGKSGEPRPRKRHRCLASVLLACQRVTIRCTEAKPGTPVVTAAAGLKRPVISIAAATAAAVLALLA